MEKAKGFTCSEATEFNTKLKAAFKDLRKRGYFARMDFQCCQSCGWAAVPAGREHKVVFYHNQDKHSINESRGTYLAWGGDAAKIQEVLKAHGLQTEHLNPNNRIWVELAAPAQPAAMTDAEYCDRLEVLYG